MRGFAHDVSRLSSAGMLGDRLIGRLGPREGRVLQVVVDEVRPPERVAVEAQHRQEGERELAVTQLGEVHREPLGARQSRGRALRRLGCLDRAGEQGEHDEQRRDQRRAEAPGRGSRPLNVTPLPRQEEAGSLDHHAHREGEAGQQQELLGLRERVPVPLEAHHAGGEQRPQRGTQCEHGRDQPHGGGAEAEQPERGRDAPENRRGYRERGGEAAELVERLGPRAEHQEHDHEQRGAGDHRDHERDQGAAGGRGALHTGDARRRGPLARQQPRHQNCGDHDADHQLRHPALPERADQRDGEQGERERPQRDEDVADDAPHARALAPPVEHDQSHGETDDDGDEQADEEQADDERDEHPPATKAGRVQGPS